MRRKPRAPWGWRPWRAGAFAAPHALHHTGFLCGDGAPRRSRRNTVRRRLQELCFTLRASPGITHFQHVAPVCQHCAYLVVAHFITEWADGWLFLATQRFPTAPENPSPDDPGMGFFVVWCAFGA